METNQQAYSAQDVVKKYISNLKLEKGEAYLFDKYRAHMDGKKVLDVGIGGGRTTHHLSAIASEYIGVDFSHEFVKYCKETYDNGTTIKIEWADARDLSAYQDAYFDFILFSFNGIDCVSVGEREQILSEFHRVLKPKGLLCFSFHNSRNVDKLYSYQMPRNPLKYYGEWERTKKVKDINGPKEAYKNKDVFSLCDGSENFSANVVYVKPEFQKEQLKKAGFDTLEFSETITSKKLSDTDLPGSDTPWIYVMAQKNQ